MDMPGLLSGSSSFLFCSIGISAGKTSPKSHGETPQTAAYVNEMLRETFENWQSEFLQLLWQVGGLAYFLYVGSPSSKENDDRTEAKLDAIIRMVGGEKAEKLIGDIDKHYLREGGHAQPHGHDAELARSAGRGHGAYAGNG
jgi:hypothetical protein